MPTVRNVELKHCGRELYEVFTGLTASNTEILLNLLAGSPEQGGREGVYTPPPHPQPPKFADNVPFFLNNPLNVPFLKIFNLK